MDTLPEGIAISAQNLGKDFRLYDSPRHFLIEFLTGRPRHKIFSALSDITFDVKKGEVVGIIGRNGSGKTTLLRILAGTLDKTAGEAVVNGRISAIMALGTGFNMELTGRENIYLGGLCLGMMPDEIRRKTDAIIEFSGLSEFIDRPCSSYSSGMQARLAFSVAASVDPDILIVDEALSTGDAAFAAKSYGRMREIADGGATVLFVTHNMQDIYNLCDRVVMLEKGRITGIGEPREIGRVYEDKIHAEMAAANRQAAPVSSASGKGGHADAEIISAEIFTPDGKSAGQMETGAEYLVRIKTRFSEDIPSVSIGFNIQNPTGITLYGVSSSHLGRDIAGEKGKTIAITFRMRCNLAPGSYSLMAVVANNVGGVAEHAFHYAMMHKLYDAMNFSVTSNHVFAGLADMGCRIENVAEEKHP